MSKTDIIHCSCLAIYIYSTYATPGFSFTMYMCTSLRNALFLTH